jgi:dipeptidyl aminopeptidase/acylaminoacyl peptidase
MLRPARLAGRPYPSGLPFYGDSSMLRLYDAELGLLETLERPELAAGAQSVHATFGSPDELLITAPDGPTWAMYRYDRRSGAFTRLPIGEGSLVEEQAGMDLAVSHRTRQVIYVHSSFRRPPEIYRLSLDGGEPQALTALNAETAAVSQLRMDRVSFRLAGGASRGGYLIQPVGAPFPPQDVPIVVYQQGGPGGAMTNRWAVTPDDPASLLPNFGIAVLFMRCLLSSSWIILCRAPDCLTAPPFLHILLEHFHSP